MLQVVKTRKNWLVVALLSVMVGACVTLTGTQTGGHVDRGLKFVHKTHPEKDLACTDCHATDAGDPPIPNHDVCGTCHDVDPNSTDKKCDQCHSKPEQGIVPRVKALSPEVKFAHKPHLDKEVACDKCHADPDSGALPKGNAMATCMNCHATVRPEMTECSVCHSELSKETRPKFRGKTRIAHDAPQVWETTHGFESKIDPKYCAICHDKEASCEECHRKNPPSNHTISWRRKSHGLRATWDRDKCAVCHEEEFCIKCHQNTKPSSHRAGWVQEPIFTHCIECHFPANQSGCTVCHEEVDHEDAPPSPHDAGFPPNCKACHPGGNPYRAPHPLNSTVRCAVCHQ